MKRVRVGCSGWNYPHWKEPLYEGRPARLWLQQYAEHFDTVEVNATFYRLPTVKAVAGWVDQTPDGFLFSVKASRFLTHVKRLRELGEGVARFYERLEPLLDSPKLGPVLWQLPESFRRDDQRLASALERLPPGRHCFDAELETWRRRFAQWRTRVDVYAYFNNDWAMARSRRNFRRYARLAESF